MNMKRPLALACLFFVIVIRIFYIIVPPEHIFYEQLFQNQIYVLGKVESVEQKEGQYGIQTTILLQHVEVYDAEQKTQYLYNHDGVICYMDGAIELAVSEYVCIKGQFQDFGIAMNKGAFDSKKYYDILNVGGTLKNATIVWESDTVNPLLKGLNHTKKYLQSKVLQYFDAPYDGLIQTMLLGEKNTLDAQIQALYKRNGLIHVLTISGLHISMIGMGIYKLARKLRCHPYVAAVVGILVILLYGQMIGMGTSTFRAICMFLFQMLAILWKRTYDRITGLMVAGMLLLIDQPLYVFHSGFLYSFASVLGIICVTPMIEDSILYMSKGKKTILMGFSVSIGVLAMTLPIQLYYFYEYPPYSILLNFLLLPLLPIIIGGAMLIMALPNEVRLISHAIALVCKLLLIGYEKACVFAEGLPGSRWIIGAPSHARVFCYYTVIVLLVVCYKKTKNTKRIFLTSSYAIVLVCLMFLRPNTREFTCTYLSVGQGDGAVLEIDKKAYIVDCGSTTESKVAEYTLIPFLKYSGISHVEVAFLSHQDADHVNGILQWLEQYDEFGITLGGIVLPDLGETLLVEQFGTLLQVAREHDIEIMTVRDGMEFDLSSTNILVHHPEPVLVDGGEPNQNSMVLEVQYKSYSLLFTGDIGKEQEALLLSKLENVGNRAYILKSAHHGSNTSNDATFIKTIYPEEVIISYGEDNKYGHPSNETMETLSHIEGNVWKTAIDGGIEVLFKQEGYEIKEYVRQAVD